MAGFLPKDVRKVPGAAAAPSAPTDGCNLRVQTDLVGVRLEVSSRLIVGQRLRVGLNLNGHISSVVCVTDDAQIVGTLAAFRGLAQLIACIGAGLEYEAIVIATSFAQCTVRVEPK